MRKRLFCLLACLLLLPAAGIAETAGSSLPEDDAETIWETVYVYNSETLRYTVEKLIYDQELCYLTQIWVQDPARQIRKATGQWKKSLSFPLAMAEEIEGTALAVNGSGYVSPQYPGIPDNYPGVSKNYHYTPLGSLTVTDGEVFRNLEGVPYFGLTLDEDGLQMYTDADNEDVLASQPIQTWSFYVNCPMMRGGKNLMPEDWRFAQRRAVRTIIARIDRQNYLILSATNEKKGGLSLFSANAFFLENFETEWVYDLDGGPSSALIYRDRQSGELVTVMGGKAKDADIMAFTE